MLISIGQDFPEEHIPLEGKENSRIKIIHVGYSFINVNSCSLAGMLHKIGLLPAGNFQQVPFAYKMYTRADKIGWQQSTEFKKAFCVDVEIEFVGVWYALSRNPLVDH